ncbi:hypothetical protein [Methanosarcina sp.]|uniref:hypothetical protein n=1 Tax=Methanosarcina sp. TaxID=2213 RepID=UPI003C74775A
MATSQERQKANLARMKKVMEEIESTTDDYDLITELHELLRKSYSLSLKWHMIVFKSEVDRSLWYLEDIRKEEIEIEKRKRRRGKETDEEPDQVDCTFSEILSAFRTGVSRITRADVFAIPKSMIGECKLQWSDAVKQKWGEDNIGQQELMERGICN